MRDIVEDLQAALNDNKYMLSHPLISAAANEIIKLRCELETIVRYPSLVIETHPKPDPMFGYKSACVTTSYTDNDKTRYIISHLTGSMPRTRYENFAKVDIHGEENERSSALSLVIQFLRSHVLPQAL